MANLDDMIRNAVPGGNIAKPLLIALLGLLGSGALFKSGDDQSPAVTAPHPPAATPPHPPAGDGGGGLLGGLGGLLDRFSRVAKEVSSIHGSGTDKISRYNLVNSGRFWDRIS